MDNIKVLLTLEPRVLQLKQKTMYVEVISGPFTKPPDPATLQRLLVRQTWDVLDEQGVFLKEFEREYNIDAPYLPKEVLTDPSGNLVLINALMQALPRLKEVAESAELVTPAE